jgi:hypothetical protein
MRVVSEGSERRRSGGSYLGRSLAEQYHQSLQYTIGESRSNRYPICPITYRQYHLTKLKRGLTQDPLDPIDDNNTQWTLVTIRKDLVEMRNLLPLGEADHVLRRDELDERELGRHGDGRCECRLPRSGRTVDEERDERSALRLSDLLDKQFPISKNRLAAPSIVR